MPSTRNSLQIDTRRLKVKGWKNIHTNSNQKTVGVAILLLDKTDFTPKKDYKRQRRTLYTDRGFNPSKRYNYKHIHT